MVVVPTKKLDYGNKKKTKDFYSRTELQQFLKTVETHEGYDWCIMFRLFVFTGIRRGELLSLTWEDIDFTDSTLTVNKALAEGIDRVLIVQTPFFIRWCPCDNTG